MPAIDPRRRHPDYERESARAGFLWDSYQGGEEYSADKYLDPYPRELDVLFEARKARVYYLNFVAAVVDAYIAAVFKREPVLEAPESFAPFVEDATGEGESLTDFVRESMTWAVAMLKTYVVVDVNKAGAPYAHVLHPANLLDYAIGQDGAFLWALVAEKFVAEDNPFEGRHAEDRLRLWTPARWFLFDEKGNQLEEEANEAGVVPIVSVVPGNMPLPTYDIARINRRVYNYCSQLDQIYVDVTFPQPYAQSSEGVESAETGEPISPDVAPIVLSTARMLLLPSDTSMPPGYLAPPEGPARQLAEEREKLISAIYSLAGLERKDPDSQKAQSGVAKAYDFRETNSRLVSIAHAAERVEDEILSLLNAYGFAGEFNVSYQKDFNVRDFALMLDDYLKISETNLPPAPKRRAALELAAQIADDASPEEKEGIRQAVEDMPDEAFAPAPVPAVGPVVGEPLEGPMDTGGNPT